MRSDYALYTVAIIFFILTFVVLATQVDFKELWTITTVVLGLLFIGLGYFQRSKLKAATIETPQISPTTVEEETETTMETIPPKIALTEVKGIGEKRAEQLKALGINSAEDLAKASAKSLAIKLKISQKFTKRWIENAKKLTGKS